MIEKLKNAGVGLLGAVRSIARKIDPKLITTTTSTAVTWVIVKVGLNADDPLVVAVVPIVVGAIVGWLTRNAASGLQDRWRAPDGGA